MKPIDAAGYMEALDRMHALDHGQGFQLEDVAAFASALLAYEHQLLAIFCTEVTIEKPEPESVLRFDFEVPERETIICRTEIPPLRPTLQIDRVHRYLRDWFHKAEGEVVACLCTPLDNRIPDHFYASQRPPAD